MRRKPSSLLFLPSSPDHILLFNCLLCFSFFRIHSIILYSKGGGTITTVPTFSFVLCFQIIITENCPVLQREKSPFPMVVCSRRQHDSPVYSRWSNSNGKIMVQFFKSLILVLHPLETCLSLSPCLLLLSLSLSLGLYVYLSIDELFIVPLNFVNPLRKAREITSWSVERII